MFRSTIDQLAAFDPALAEELVAMYPNPQRQSGLRDRLKRPRPHYRFFDRR
ncbi:MAG: hypothetical protein QM783_18775 [Phycisphaerales bacterium]